MNQTPFHRAVRTALQEQDKTAYRMAKDLGKHPNNFTTSLNREPRLDTIQLYAQYLGMTTVELVARVEALEAMQIRAEDAAPALREYMKTQNY